MDINFLRSIATVLAALAFIGVCVWAYGSKRKAGFDEAAQLPFADDHLDNESEVEARKK
jgi:cytochrome c oxidase cbb3-type subunit 4